LREIFDLSRVDEFTMEANPATVTSDYCAMLREMGVNRLSFGAQSFARDELAMLERHHDPEDVPRSVDIARAAGFTRVNVDLIYGIPNQDLASWLRSLEAAISLGTPHVSAYGLTYEPNTPMAVKKRLGHFRAVEESVELEMLHATRQRLTQAGMSAYEISNYARPGEECRHNLMYWNGGDYIGLGPSAASHISGTRWKNRPHLGEWEAAIDADGLPAADVESLSTRQRAAELAMLQLRLAVGIDYADFAARTGEDAHTLFGSIVSRLTQLGLLEHDARGFRLTEKGIDVADAVALEMMP
jgi:oxygen-independent coproporphyrinogen-3 oxidase